MPKLGIFILLFYIIHMGFGWLYRAVQSRACTIVRMSKYRVYLYCLTYPPSDIQIAIHIAVRFLYLAYLI